LKCFLLIWMLYVVPTLNTVLSFSEKCLISLNYYYFCILSNQIEWRHITSLEDPVWKAITGTNTKCRIIVITITVIIISHGGLFRFNLTRKNVMTKKQLNLWISNFNLFNILFIHVLNFCINYQSRFFLTFSNFV
jgi:hypothetical protein